MDMETWFAPAIELGQLVERVPGGGARGETEAGMADQKFGLSFPAAYSAELQRCRFFAGASSGRENQCDQKRFFYESGNAVSAAGRRKTLSDALSPA